MSDAHIRVEVSESIATLTIDRPDVRNALNLQTVRECHGALDELAGHGELPSVLDNRH